ncbi:MAG: hypothetical protein RLZ36_261 [Pseudomonadota bacterium]|jgi:hypothetical protein
MAQKFLVKQIKSGQAQKSSVVDGGAGLLGNALVLQATEGARYQLMNVATLVSPAKLQIKRHGVDLHVALPGGDIEVPDVVIQGYFSVKQVTLWGLSIEGEVLAYNTGSLVSGSVTQESLMGALPSLEGAAAQQVVTESASVTATLGGSGLLSSPWFWAAGLGVAAAASRGKGGETPPNASDPQAIISQYSGGGTSTAPTQKNYEALGVTLPTIANSTDVLNAMNAVVASKSASEVSDAAKLNAIAQALKTAYDKILAEANGTAADATPSANPTRDDYASVGIAVPSETLTLDLLNNALGELATTDVDTVAELKTLALTAGDVMLMAAGKATSQTDAQLVLGLNALLKSAYVSAANLAAIKTAIVSTADDGTAVDTIAELKAIVQATAALQTLRDYANASGGVGVTQPSLNTYKDAGLKALNNLSEATASADIDAATVLANVGSTWLQALNSALDQQTGDATLTKDTLQALVDSYYRILSEADGVSNAIANVDVYPNTADVIGSLAGTNDPSQADYTRIGVTVGNAKTVDLLNDYVGAANKTAVDTVNEINVIAKAAYNVMKQAGVPVGTDIAQPALYATTDEWIAGLNTLLGLNTTTGVNSSNIEAMKTTLSRSTDSAAVDTLQEIRQLLPLVRIQAFADVPVFAPTLTDWAAVGVKAKNALADTSATLDLAASGAYAGYTNITALNSALDRWANTGTNLDTLADAKTTLQGVADSYARVWGEADGDRTVDVNVNNSSAGNDPAQADYANLLGGDTQLTTLVGSANAKWLDLLNDCLGGLTTLSVSTATQVEDLIRVATNVMNQAVGIGWSYTNNSEWVSALSSLGISGLSTMNATDLATVKTAITDVSASAQIDTWAELQSIVSTVRINHYAELNTNTTPTFTDYQAFFDYGTSGKTDLANTTTYLNAFNDAVNYKPSNAFTSAEIKSLVNGYAAILAEANGAATDQQSYDPNAADYIAVGVGSNDSNVLTLLSHASDGTEATNTAELVTLMTDVVANKNQSEVDTVNELTGIAKIIAKIYDLESYSGTATNGGSTGIASSAYTAIYGGALQVSELKALGLDTTNLENNYYSTSVLNKRLYDVYDHITAIDHTSANSRALLDSLQELQTLITNTSVITA